MVYQIPPHMFMRLLSRRFNVDQLRRYRSQLNPTEYYRATESKLYFSLQVQDLENKLQHEEGSLVFSETQSDIDKYAQNIHETEQLLSSISHKALTPRTGPVTSTLDTVLNKHRITPQAYHSRSFVGNHCHKYLQPNVYKDLTDTIVKQTQTLTSNPFLIDKACTIQITFNDLNNAFRTVHNAISHTKPIDPNSLTDMQAAIDNYMTIYRRMFPHKVIPKQHLLEKHCIPHIKKYMFGLDLLGSREQKTATK
ncbi:amine oxidase [Plakobranchus ocellatus]|uniref:Amine oxidase n=1 Tax=Plakobranchus ocellatus TaxID=259542 RepID=A0AAV4DRP3_9GAST|nr:amine oxidase [Plakobranchus ocellatus]